MTPKEKAIELTEKFKPHVNPYVGSGMLSNSTDDAVILYQAKDCAIIAVNEMLHQFNAAVLLNSTQSEFTPQANKIWAFWVNVKSEIKNLCEQK